MRRFFVVVYRNTYDGTIEGTHLCALTYPNEPQVVPPNVFLGPFGAPHLARLAARDLWLQEYPYPCDIQEAQDYDQASHGR